MVQDSDQKEWVLILSSIGVYNLDRTAHIFALSMLGTYKRSNDEPEITLTFHRDTLQKRLELEVKGEYVTMPDGIFYKINNFSTIQMSLRGGHLFSLAPPARANVPTKQSPCLRGYFSSK